MHGKRWFLLLLGVGLLLILGLLLLWNLGEFSLASRRPTQTWTGLAPPISLEAAAIRAEARARAWAGDAILVWVTAAWSPPPEWLETDYPPIAWSLYYYSAQQRALASVGIRGDQDYWSPPIPLEDPLPELSPFPPAQGINVAWLSFRAAGGQEFLQTHPGATVQFRLRKEGEGLTWVVVGIAPPEAAFEVRVDAQNGRILAVE